MSRTKGKWKVKSKKGFDWQIVARDGYVVAVIPYDDFYGRPTEDPKNARLMAAAPEILDALKAVVAVADRKTKEFEAARAAIAKAEGRA